MSYPDTAKETTVWTYARGCFLEQVINILDDPSGLDKETLDWLRQVALAIGYHFDTLIKENGTPFEQERLRALVAKLDAH